LSTKIGQVVGLDRLAGHVPSRNSVMAGVAAQLMPISLEQVIEVPSGIGGRRLTQQ